MKSTALLLASLLFAQTPLSAQLQPGDIAFVLFDADGDELAGEGRDQFAFAALNDIAAGEEIYFRDDEWTGTAFAGNSVGELSEDELLWTSPAGGVAAGTIVVFSENGTAPIVSTGTVIQTIGAAPGLGISDGGDEIWAYLGTSNTPETFLAAISSEGFNGSPNTLDGTNLVAETAFAIELQNNVNNAFYDGPREGLALVANYPILIEEVDTNWNQDFPQGMDLIANTTPFVTGGTAVVFTTLSFSLELFPENAGAAASTGTVNFSSPRDVDTIVSLSSSDTTEVTIQATVTIPAGDDSATFPIDAVDDGIDDGDQSVFITARAPNIAGDQFSLTVTDDGDAPGTALETGDILFTCFNGDNESFGFVAIDDIPAGEVIFFTDEEWDGFAFGDGESDVIWTSPAGGLSAGEVVIVSGSELGSATVSGGGTIVENGTLSLSQNNETIYAYQGVAVRQPVTFLAVISNTAEGIITNTGLTAGVDALFLEEASDVGDYTGPRSGLTSIAGYAALIADVANNFAVVNNGDNSALLCNGTDFTSNPPLVIEIVDCGFLGDEFFLDLSVPTSGLTVTSAPTLDFSSSREVFATIDSTNPNRFLIPLSERGALSDFFRVETE